MYEMKKALSRILRLIVICPILIYLLITGLFEHKYDYAVISCVSEISATHVVTASGLCKTEKYRLETEDMIMHIVYQLARRNVVKVTVKDTAGSGIIWKLDKDIIIASNRHLLMNDVEACVTFCDGETANAEIIGYSQQYDIGFMRVHENEINGKALRDIYETVPVLYETENEAEKKAFLERYKDRGILQVGVDMENTTFDYSSGTIRGLNYMPVFNTTVLETQCYAKAGMSGGGVFDSEGKFLAMISGGEVPEDAENREADITYSIPAKLINEEYKNIIK
jgi:S1-C subfamily serine protease